MTTARTLTPPLGPAMREIEAIAIEIVDRLLRPPSPWADTYNIGSLDFAYTALKEFVDLPGHDADTRAVIVEHYLEPGWPCLFWAEIEPCIFGVRVTVDPNSPEIGPALRAEAEQRKEAALEPEFVAAREKGRRILGLDGKKLN